MLNAHTHEQIHPNIAPTESAAAAATVQTTESTATAAKRKTAQHSPVCVCVWACVLLPKFNKSEWNNRTSNDKFSKPSDFCLEIKNRRSFELKNSTQIHTRKIIEELKQLEN